MMAMCYNLKYMAKIEEQVGKNIQKIRKSRNLTQQELADKIDMNRAHLGHLEQGRKSPSLETIEKIAKALRVKISEIFNF